MKKKKYSAERAITRFLIGSHYVFDVRDPLSELPEITNTGYGHSNPVSRMLMKKNIRQLHGIFDVKQLKWKSTIEVEFFDGKEVYVRKAEIVWFGLLKGCEGEYQQTIEEIFEKSNMKHYVMTHVKAEVIGLSDIQDSDFTITKGEAA